MTRKIVMSDLRDILTLLAHNGSYRQIQKKVGVSHALIGKIKRRIRELGKPIEELLKLNDLALQAQIYPPRKVTRRLPDWNFVYDKSQKQKVSLLMIYEEIYSKEDGGEDGPPPMAYSTFCQNFEIWKRQTGHFEQVCNLLVAPGEQMQIDFAGDTFKWIEKKTGEIHIGQVFVACLPASKLTFAYVTEKQKRPDWIKGTVAAVEYFGGCPKTLVVDNAKALVSKADRYEAIFPKQIKSLCAYYKMVPDACKPGKPREKNRVEAAVNDVERHVIAKMCLNGIPVYEDLNELNKDVKKHCDEFNLRKFQRNKEHSRRSLFEFYEKDTLQKLPKLPYSEVELLCLRVDIGHCVRINRDGGHRYSVPAEYINKIVLVALSNNQVEISDIQTLTVITVHERCFNTVGEKTHILPKHMTAKEKAIRPSPAWFKKILKDGKAREKEVNQVVDRIFELRTPMTATKWCHGLVSLLKRTDPEVFSDALEIAHRYDCCSYQYIKDCIETLEGRAELNKRQGQLFKKEKEKEEEKKKEKNKETGEEEDEEDDYKTPKHKNIRNNYH